MRRRLRRWLGLPRWGWRQYWLFFLVVFGLAAAASVITGALDEWRRTWDPFKQFEGTVREMVQQQKKEMEKEMERKTRR